MSRRLAYWGVEMAFWIAVPLAYSDYLCDCDVGYHLFSGGVFVVLNVPRFFWPPAIDNLFYVSSNLGLEM